MVSTLVIWGVLTEALNITQNLVIIFFCWLQQQSTKKLTPPPGQRHCYAANGSQKNPP